jgi:hypothetical protein
MARNSAHRPRQVVRLSSAVGLWLAVVAVTQGAVCAELGDALRRMEEGIELRLCPPATLHQTPSRSSEPEPIEPWELVSV